MKRLLMIIIIMLIAFPVIANSWLGTKAPDEPKEVGDIIFNDGSAIPYTEGLNLTSKQKKAAIAVMFYKGTGLNSGDDTSTVRILGVGLKQNVGLRQNNKNLVWCSNNADGYNNNISSIQCFPDKSAKTLTFVGDKNGSDNLEQMEAYEGIDDTDKSSNYPAFYFAKNYRTAAQNLGREYREGWYLPSVAELLEIYKNGIGKSKLFDLDAAIELCGGNKFESNVYISSTQYPFINTSKYSLSFGGGGWGDGTKINCGSDKVCAIREFN